MQLRDPELLRRYMRSQCCSQSRLAAMAGVKRQFIHRLYHGHANACSERVAARIEDTLRVLPGTLFLADWSSTTDTSVVRRQRASA